MLGIPEEQTCFEKRAVVLERYCKVNK